MINSDLVEKRSDSKTHQAWLKEEGKAARGVEREKLREL